MAQQLRAHTALAENLSWVPNNHIWQLTASCNCSSRKFWHLCPLRTLCSHTQTHIQMHTHTQHFKYFYYIFSLFTFQMLSPFLVFPKKKKNQKPKILSPHYYPCSPTHPLPLPGPGIPLHWGIKPYRTKSLSSHWWSIRPSSAIYVTGAMAVLCDWWFSPCKL